jgi:hypothetical protein
MSDGQLSSMTRAMVEAAKADAPGAAARAKVWSQVSASVGGAAAAGGSAAAAAAGGTSAAKLLAVGALFGGTLTVGLAVTVLRVSHAPGEVRAAAVASAEIAPIGMGGAPTVAVESSPATTAEPPTVPVSALLPAPALAPLHAAGGGSAYAAAHASAPAHVAASAPASAPVSAQPAAPIDSLAREAQLVSEARGALGRGDAARALQAVRAARALPSHQLTPEELAVESQALRALGRPAEATQVDETLRSQFPESALAR